MNHKSTKFILMIIETIYQINKVIHRFNHIEKKVILLTLQISTTYPHFLHMLIIFIHILDNFWITFYKPLHNLSIFDILFILAVVYNF